MKALDVRAIARFAVLFIITGASAAVLPASAQDYEVFDAETGAIYDPGLPAGNWEQYPAETYEMNNEFAYGDIVVATPGGDWMNDNMPSGLQTDHDFTAWDYPEATEQNTTLWTTSPGSYEGTYVPGSGTTEWDTGYFDPNAAGGYTPGYFDPASAGAYTPGYFDPGMAGAYTPGYFE